MGSSKPGTPQEKIGEGASAVLNTTEEKAESFEKNNDNHHTTQQTRFCNNFPRKLRFPKHRALQKPTKTQRRKKRYQHLPITTTCQNPYTRKPTPNKKKKKPTTPKTQSYRKSRGRYAERPPPQRYQRQKRKRMNRKHPPKNRTSQGHRQSNERRPKGKREAEF